MCDLFIGYELLVVFLYLFCTSGCSSMVLNKFVDLAGAWQRPLIPILYQPCEIPIIYRFIYHLDYTNERARVYFWDKLARSLGYTGPQVFTRSTSVKDSVVESPSKDATDGQLMEEKADVKKSQTVHQVKEANSGINNLSETSLVNNHEKPEMEPEGNKKKENTDKPKKPLILRIRKFKNKNGSKSPTTA